MTHPILDALDADWGRLGAGAEMAEALARWGRTHPVLRYPSPQALVDDVRARRDDPAAADLVLAALVDHARTDQLAVRCGPAAAAAPRPARSRPGRLAGRLRDRRGRLRPGLARRSLGRAGASAERGNG